MVLKGKNHLGNHFGAFAIKLPIFWGAFNHIKQKRDDQALRPMYETSKKIENWAMTKLSLVSFH